MRIKDIAEAAEVSTATVSRVLNGKQHVRPEVQEKVLAVVKRMNYTPNRAARSLRSKQSSMIGLVVADIQNPFFTSVCRAVEDVAQAHNYSIILCNTDENPEKEQRYLELLQNENAAGIILSPTKRLAKHFPQELANKTPMVLIDRKIKGADVDCVLIDNFSAAKTLTTHLLKNGLTRIAGLFGSPSVTGEERQLGYRTAFQESGIKIDPNLIIELPAKMENAYEAVIKLLESESPPEAIMTSSGLLANGAFRAIRDKDIEIPDSLAFVTFDESPWTSMTRPAITVIKQPTYDIGLTAGEMLIKRITEKDRPTRQVVLSSRLIIRQSCATHR